MTADSEGFRYPVIDSEKCVKCGKCEAVCPISRECSLSEKLEPREVYAAYSKDEQTRRKSSSGGIFFELAKQIIGNDGVVFGAAFQPDMGVRHQSAETMQELEALLGSKYVQSDIADSYRQAETLLKQGRTVLFTGTPCQIGGLHRFLGKKYDHLITQDIVCHGVPSPLAWEQYLAQKHREFQSRVSKVFFRDKSLGWRSYSLWMAFENQKEYREKAGNDLYMRSFLMNYSLRPSCYQCAFKSLVSGSDITLADFWGIEHCFPEMADNKGTSLVLLHSENGMGLFESIRNNLVCKRTDVGTATRLNASLRESAVCPEHRADFMEIMGRKSFGEAAGKYCKPPSLVRRFLRKLKKWTAGIVK